MSVPADSRSEQARQFYNAAATTSTDFSFMNYGYAPLSADLEGTAEPERYCLQLYRHLFGNVDLRGKKVVEVSCGRGGGAAHVARHLSARELPRHRHQRTKPGVGDAAVRRRAST